MKTIIRNFHFIFRRFKTTLILNVVGLSIAFATFIIIMMQVNYDQSFDKSYKDYNRIYRIDLEYQGVKMGILSRPIADVLFKSPQIEVGTLFETLYSEEPLAVETNGNSIGFLENVIKVYPSFTEMFSFEMIEGTGDILNEPSKVIIPQSIAHKMFGDESAIDKRLKKENGYDFIIGGVYKDFPLNSSVKNTIYISIPKEENVNNWGNTNYCVYVKLLKSASIDDILQSYYANIKVATANVESLYANLGDVNLNFVPMEELHYVTDVEYDRTPKSSRQTIMILFAIAFIIVIIAAVNFMNFSMALTPMRIRSINTQKVLGASDSELRFSLLIESLLIAALSYCIALLLVYLVSQTTVASLIDAEMNLLSYPLLVVVAALVALITGLLSGLYPAFYITSFTPALVLKGSFGLSPKGRQLRNILIGIQFVASFALIISTSFMYLQNKHIHNTPLGYDKDQLIVTRASKELFGKKDIFASQLQAFSGIEQVSYCHALLSSADQYMTWGMPYKGKHINFTCLPVYPSFLEVMGIKVLEGRNFREEDLANNQGTFIFNQKARDQFDLQLNDEIEQIDIIGFISDINYTTFHSATTPMAFYVRSNFDSWGTPIYAYIKVKAGSDMRAAMEHVKTTVKTIDPLFLFDVSFYDEVLNKTYERENRLTMMIAIFSLIAIIISVVGVFGLVFFDCEYRRKEIGVRKVLGSSIDEILLLFNKTYARLLVVSFVIACPIAYYVISTWLENFSSHTPMHWWVFVLSGIFVAIVTFATVSVQRQSCNKQSCRCATERINVFCTKSFEDYENNI